MTSRSLRLGNSRLKLEGRNWLLQMVKDVEIALQIGVHFQNVHAPHHQPGRVQQRLRARQACQTQLESHHNLSLLFWPKLPKPQLEMHFSKSTALVVVGLEFFLALRGLKQLKTEFVVTAPASAKRASYGYDWRHC